MLDSLVRVSRRVLRVPKAVTSPTGIMQIGLSEDTARQQLTRLGDGASSRCFAALYFASTAGQPAGQPGVCRVRANDATGAPPGRRPTPNGSRRPTRGEVHDDDDGRCMDGGVPSGRDPTGNARRLEAFAADDESPHSAFWVFQVYP
ncbi:hypothetical protein KM043_012390 [Ampulex compressa]|nr:hypothetical protein KM043_012390 [Ampulex compressa]